MSRERISPEKRSDRSSKRLGRIQSVPPSGKSAPRRNYNADITVDRLKELFKYDKETGVFTRLKSWRGAKSNSVAGRIIKSGRKAHGYKSYIRIPVDGVNYRAHRLAWLYETGHWPAEDIDHENGDGTDNRWSNLREASISQNCGNTPLRKDNKSGYKGVYFDKRINKWVAQISCPKKVYLGSFLTPEAARDQYLKAAAKRYGEFARAA